MNVRWLSLIAVISMLPIATGCGSLKHLLFGAGAACGGCAAGAPACNVPPTCGPMQGGQCGCGSEYGSGYLDAMEQGYPVDGTIIGNPALGSGIYNGMPVESYNQNEWYPPATGSSVGGQPLAPMTPAPLSSGTGTRIP